MNNTPHTPSTWQVDHSGTCHIGIKDKNERTIAFCNLQNEDGDEDEANARLIAAAPDLLSALESAYNAIAWDIPGGNLSDDDEEALLDVIREALGKAKGEA
jgi:hypothetical protein